MEDFGSKWFLKIIATSFITLAVAVSILPTTHGAEIFLDVRSYLQFTGSRNILNGAESSLGFGFRFCNNKGMLIYQNGGGGFFGVGVNAGRIYLEWKMANKIIELYIGNGGLTSNTTYNVLLLNLGTRQASATINGVGARVNYLVNMMEVDAPLNTRLLTGDLFIGGYKDVRDLRVNTDRLIAYLVVCLDYITVGGTQINLAGADEMVGTNGCPLDFCAPPTIVTTETSSSYVSMNVALPPGTRTIVSFRFRTRASAGMLMYYGGPAYLLVYLNFRGRLTLGLNTKGSGPGVFRETTNSDYNNGEWHYIRIVREGNVASMEDIAGRKLAETIFTDGADSAMSLNARELLIGGLSDPQIWLTLPSDVPRLSLKGCFEAPRFISTGMTAEPPPLLNFDNQIKSEIGTFHGGCFPSRVCEPVCPSPGQVCNFTCVCAPGFDTLQTTPRLLCQNINDCVVNPCQNGGTCRDGIQDYECICPIAFNRGKNCELRNLCFPNPCTNGGTCADLPTSALGYQCLCPTGYTGQFCQQNIDECVTGSVICANGGTCQDLIGDYRCLCVSGFTGRTCLENINECLSQPCLNNGQCNDFINGYTCTCNNGWGGVRCELNINECLSLPCRNGGICVDRINSFQCQCQAGYTGILCETQINECVSQPCRNQGFCIDSVNGFSCNCAAGWTGIQCTQDILECLSQPCLNNGFCVDGINRYTCNCRPGFQGSRCEFNTNECTSSPCQHNGVCSDGVNSFTCQCPAAWQGALCEQDVNECLSFPCSNNGQCQNFEGFYTCNCAPGFTGRNCQTNINECLSQPCLNGATCQDFTNFYLCNCAPGYNGQLCQNNINECVPNPCGLNGICRDLVNGFSCLCAQGYTGEKCSVDINECLSQPCINGGVCQDRVASFSCVCAQGYTGSQCEININECVQPETHRCENGAQCIDGINTYSCQCRPGWEGRFCELDINECLSSPCQNGGTCEDKLNGFLCRCPPNFTGLVCSQDVNECITQIPCQNYLSCNNTYGSYTCDCLPGWMGRNCNTQINECDSSPCYFGGTCRDLVNGFSCQCVAGFLGQRCEAIVRQCRYSFPCGNNAICVEKPQGGHTCFCNAGYQGSSCQEEINECLSSPCFNGGICKNLVNNYSCECLPGFQGSSCLIDINECASNPCQNQGICQETTANMYSCICQPGSTGVNCEVDINECQSTPCQSFQLCEDFVNGYRCKCPDGFTGVRCDVLIDKCYSNPCQNAGTCTLSGAGYVCACQYPWQGINCEINQDPCFNNPCLHLGTCFQTGVSPGFRCVCAEGFIGERCQGDIYDCLSNPCRNGGSCVEFVDGKAGYECQCPAPYGGRFCEVDSRGCGQVNQCQNGGTCQPLFESFRCLCLPGWTGDRCQNEINECVVSNPCRNGAACLNTPGSYTCVCTSFWTGQNCDQDITECTSKPCLNNATCVEQQGGRFFCQCLPGFSGRLCEENINECASDPCVNGICLNQAGRYQCQCNQGYTGVNCEVALKECNSQPCLNGATCLDLGNGYVCRCARGFVGVHCEINLNECVSSPCLNGGQCQDIADGFTCTCTVGYTGIRCETRINECTVFQPCRNGATCFNINNGFQCQCSPGWTGVTCEIATNECSPNPCINGQCVDSVGSYRCNCFSGYTGVNCSIDIRECTPNPCLNGGNCIEPSPGSYQCQCPPGVTGTNCEFASFATFTGSNFILTPNPRGAFPTTRRKRQVDLVHHISIADGYDPRNDTDRLTIEFTFSTTVLDGILLFSNGVDDKGNLQHLVVELVSGSLRVSASFGTETLSQILPLNLPADGILSANITITIGRGNLFINSSDCDEGICSVNATAKSYAGNVILDGSLYIGGLPQLTPFIRSKLQTIKYFRGCLGDFKINDEPVNFGTVSPLARLVLFGESPADIYPTPGCDVHKPCNKTYCQNGGKCIDLWTEKTCECIVGFTGDKCENQNIAQFVLNSFLYFPGQDDIKSINFKLSIKEPDGLLLYTLTANPVAVIVGGGTLQVHLVATNGDIIVQSDINMLNGDWYTIRIKLENNQINLQVRDSLNKSIDIKTASVAGLLRVRAPVFVGQLHTDAVANLWRNRPVALPSFNSFIGCLQELVLNNRSVLMDSASVSDLGNDPPAAVAGCSRELSCEADLCGAQGQCEPHWDNYTCQCTEDYVGQHCQQVSASTYNGLTSYVEVTIDTSLIAFGGHGSLELRTRERMGRLMFIQLYHDGGSPTDSLELQVFGGVIQLSARIADQIKSLTGPVSVSDGEWHVASWTYEPDDLTLIVDNMTVSSKLDWNIHTQNRDQKITLFLGARPFSPNQMDTIIGYYKGCLRDVQLNNHRVHYLEPDTVEPGVTITRVATEVRCNGDNVCNVNPCPANAFCVDEWNQFSCECVEGWQGPMCNDSANDCLNHACQNSATCIDGFQNYTCGCVVGYTGTYCERVIMACDSQLCVIENTMTCASLFPADYRCVCNIGWEGKNCELNTDDCAVVPCLNGGTCNDLLNGFNCTCPEDYLGSQCEKRSVCASLPCYNGGSCIPSPDNTQYTCSCPALYTGRQCQTYNTCYGNNCQGNSTCLIEPNSFICACSDGYHGDKCQFVDGCYGDPCLNGGKCTKIRSNFTCDCTKHYTGKTCDIAINKCDTNLCQNGGECFFNTSQPEQPFVCECPLGYTGVTCEFNINECESNPCRNSGLCVETKPETGQPFIPGYTCDCPVSHTGTHCETAIDECASDPCINNATCLDGISGYQCACIPGFGGVHCELDRRGCSSAPCQNQAPCTDLSGSGIYVCQCPTGYTGINCETNIDDCVQNECYNGAECVDGLGSYTCKCTDGYDGPHCEQVIDACYSRPCLNNGQCIYTSLCSCVDVLVKCRWRDEICQREECKLRTQCVAYDRAYLCLCNGTGYGGDYCERDIDECMLGTHLCSNGGSCQNTASSYQCVCQGTGYAGTFCREDVDECSALATPCFNGGSCRNTEGSYVCLCPPGYEGRDCGQHITPCTRVTCANGGSCVGNGVCLCTTGWTGPNCTEPIDQCSTSPCLNNGVCSNTLQTSLRYFCNCTGTGYLGDNCEVNEDECLIPKPCSGRGTCADTAGNYSCTCLEGYTGWDCDILIPAPETSSSLSTIILPVILVLAALLLLLLIVICYVYRSRKYRGRYRPSEEETKHNLPYTISNMLEKDTKELLI